MNEVIYNLFIVFFVFSSVIILFSSLEKINQKITKKLLRVIFLYYSF
ncbi:hypothetical protein MNB_SUP05-5-685 [hydrothermal vent metagenome]|uniref:Uncharacterized protein n=1 Tax=hydrothermal vent metagenome TaxID=652676 RepID=A0A1W1CLR2_9ZZZZ